MSVEYLPIYPIILISFVTSLQVIARRKIASSDPLEFFGS